MYIDLNKQQKLIRRRIHTLKAKRKNLLRTYIAPNDSLIQTYMVYLFYNAKTRQYLHSMSHAHHLLLFVLFCFVSFRRFVYHASFGFKMEHIYISDIYNSIDICII